MKWGTRNNGPTKKDNAVKTRRFGRKREIDACAVSIAAAPRARCVDRPIGAPLQDKGHDWL